MKYLLLDTNIYLHYVDFEQIDWGSIIGDSNFAILVPYTVIKEIDKHKDNSKDKIKTKARKVSGKFSKYFLKEDEVPKVNLILIEEPKDAILSQYALNRNICDDVILGSVLGLGYKEDIVVISHDNTLLIKAKHLGLKFLPMMPEKYLLKEEKTEEEKEYERCRKELESLKNRQANPEIRFSNSEQILYLKRPNKLDIEHRLEEIMAEIKSSHPKIYRSPSNNPDTSSPFGNLLDLSYNIRYAIYSDKQIEHHNQEMDKYYAYCEKYHRFKLTNEMLSEQIKELDFVISNSGNAATGEMNIFLNFPEEVRLYNNRSVSRMHAIEPEEPYIGFDFNPFGNGPGAAKYISPFGGMNIPQMKCWDLAKDIKESSINISQDSLIHNVKRHIDIKDCLYIDCLQCHNFSIKWDICAEGCADKISGKLYVVITDDN